MTDKEINKKLFKDFFSEREDLTIFDIGTYDGKDSLEFSTLFPKSNIFSFEADKRSVEIFNKIVGKTKNINLIETALSDVDGEIDWYASDSETRRHYSDQDNWSASSSLKKPDNHLNVFKDISFKKAQQIKSMRLDTWMMQNKDIKNIDIMWVDVNGGEKEFIDGAIETLTNKVKYLYIEFVCVGTKALYKESPNANDIKNKLKSFDSLGIYNFMGNFGNMLLKNREIK